MLHLLQVEELKKELKEIKGHLRSQCDLASELKLLVEQRASRIQHLERLLYRRSNINGSLVGSRGGPSERRCSPCRLPVLTYVSPCRWTALPGSYPWLPRTSV